MALEDFCPFKEILQRKPEQVSEMKIDPADSNVGLVQEHKI